MDEARVDSWLWSVRIYKTRTLATEACSAGHVRVNGKPAKPASSVRVGDKVTVRTHGVERVLEVATVVNKRVGAPLAAEYMIDHTPPAPREEAPFVRDRSAGRPTKKDRRRMDRFRGAL